MSEGLSAVEAATIADGCWINGCPASSLRTFSIDSRKLTPGDVFVALRTARADGHAFLGAAATAGAVAALCAQADSGVRLPQLVVRDPLQALQRLAAHWRTRFTGPVVAITGSFGKTTVKEMLASIAGPDWLHTEGNLNNHLGVPLTLFRVDPHWHTGAIIEAGINSPGEMAVLAGMIQPRVALVTAVGPAHLEQLGDLNGVAREKAVLPQSVHSGGKVIFPAELLSYAPFHQMNGDVEVLAVAENGMPVPELTASGSPVKSCFYEWKPSREARGQGDLHLPVEGWEPFRFTAASPGMVSNLALVAHAGLALGFTPAQIQAGLSSWRPFRQRGEIVNSGSTTYFVDCYNANPGSMLDSVQRFANLFPDMPHLYVIGSMNELGPDSADWHRQTMASLPLQKDARVCLVGPQAPIMADALRARGIPPSLLQTASAANDLAAEVSGFSGAVFLKGSRSLRLETLVPCGGASC